MRLIWIVCLLIPLTLTAHAVTPPATRLSEPRSVITAADGDRLEPLALLQMPDVRSQQLLWTWLAFSPDGAMLAASKMLDASTRVTRLWDTDTGEPLGLIEAPLGPGSPLFSPDSRALVAAVIDGTGGLDVALWDVATLRRFNWTLRLPPQPPTQGCSPPGMSGLAFTPDGDLLAYGLQYCQRTLRVWNPRNARLLPEPTTTTWRARVISHADGRPLAVFNSNGGTTLRDLVTDEPLLTFTHDGRLEHIIISPAGDRLAYTLQLEKTIRLVSLPDGQPHSTIVPPINILTELAFSPDGALIVTVGIGEEPVHLFDVATGAQIAAFGRQMAQHAAFSPDGTLLATGTLNGDVEVYGVVE